MIAWSRALFTGGRRPGYRHMRLRELEVLAEENRGERIAWG
ncbi:hypothetical protein [Streptomyces nanshensis]|nr:hypothetical protein [Streptomyces nanshensis]